MYNVIESPELASRCVELGLCSEGISEATPLTDVWITWDAGPGSSGGSCQAFKLSELLLAMMRRIRQDGIF